MDIHRIPESSRVWHRIVPNRLDGMDNLFIETNISWNGGWHLRLILRYQTWNMNKTLMITSRNVLSAQMSQCLQSNVNRPGAAPQHNQQFQSQYCPSPTPSELKCYVNCHEYQWNCRFVHSCPLQTYPPGNWKNFL